MPTSRDGLVQGTAQRRSSQSHDWTGVRDSGAHPSDAVIRSRDEASTSYRRKCSSSMRTGRWTFIAGTEGFAIVARCEQPPPDETNASHSRRIEIESPCE
jgi:hypothetical protein